MRIRAYFLFFCLFISARVGALEAVLSHSIFYLSDPINPAGLNPYMEAYWQVNPKTVHFSTNADKGIIARIQVDVLITNDTGKIIKEDQYIYQTRPCHTVDELTVLNILELKRYLITPGLMKMSLRLTDLNDTANHFRATDTFRVSRLPNTSFYGSIELIDTFYESDVRSPFRKHGNQYIPLCEAFFDSYKGSISYYTELYQLNKIDKADFPVIQSVFVSKKESATPQGSLLRKDTITSPDYSFCSGTFDIKKLPSGNYYLNVLLSTRDNRTLASNSIFFQRLNTYKNTEEIKAQKMALDTGLEQINVVDLNKTFIAKYTLPQVIAILKMLRPVSDAIGASDIDAFLKKPDDMYMRYFIYNYFKAIDPQKPEKAWKEYSEKVTEVNKLFTGHGTPGYETERGYMYLRYGPPSEMVTQLHEKGALPYEIWQYNMLKERQGKLISNGVILFYKQYETDFDFKVLHTNISGELHNMGWRSFLYNSADQNTDNSNNLVEQYIGNK